MRTGGEVGDNRLGDEGGEAGGSRGQSGGHSADGDGEGVGSAHQHELGAGVKSIPAEPEDHHAQHEERGVVACEVVGLRQL